MIAIALGSNLGDRENYLLQALTMIQDLGQIVQVSSIYQAAAMSDRPQNQFLNAACAIDTSDSPRELFHHLKRIENQLGRQERGRWFEREIDLDLVLFHDTVTVSKDLIVPHPGLHLRDFVLIPLLEMDRTLIHPVFNTSLQELNQSLYHRFVESVYLPLSQWQGARTLLSGH